MWTETLRALTATLLLCLLAPLVVAQEQGQYRSRVLLDPLGEMGKGTEMSVGELEQQIDSIEDPYARSSAGRFLARHYVQEKDYASAIAYYEEALGTAGLSDVANREMLRELAQVYLLEKNYKSAARVLQRALDIDLVPGARDFLLLAHTQYRMGDYVAVVASLDGIGAHGLTLELGQMRQALALYYRAGAYEQCEDILEQLLKIEPGKPEHWHQLASVYLQQNKREQALDQLLLARQKKIAFTNAELTLLIDLQAISGNPYGAAATLEGAMAANELPGDAANQRKLFELWLQARERDRARAALDRAATVSGDTELYLYLAQLQMEDEEWAPMQQTLLAACTERLADNYVSRANLLLGVSLYKQDRTDEARRAFINATLVGGANAQAADWLKFMDAAPATEAELRRVRGPCYGSEGKREALAELAEDEGDNTVAEPVPAPSEITDTAPVQIKTVAARRFFYSSHSQSIAELIPEVGALAARLNVSLVKANGNADGPLHILALPDEDLRLAIPLRGSAQARGRYRIYKADAFTCAWIQLGADQDPERVLAEFTERVRAAGHGLTGEYRMVLSPGENLRAEFQLGIE